MKADLYSIIETLDLNTEDVQRRLMQTYRSVRKTVREKPEKSILVAVTCGFALGCFFSKIFSED